MNNERPLSYLTNRLAIAMIIIFFLISWRVVLTRSDHRAIIISLLIALSGAIGLLVVTIASPNKQIEWISKILDKKE